MNSFDFKIRKNGGSKGDTATKIHVDLQIDGENYGLNYNLDYKNLKSRDEKVRFFEFE